jgi:hypothetical protein
MNKFASILMNAYLDGLRLSNSYNMIYLEAFQKALAENGKKNDVIGEATTTPALNTGNRRGILPSNMLESVYNNWLRNVDKDLEKELKSESFVSLLSRYTQSLLELRSFFEKMGYPVFILDRMFDWYVKSCMVFSLIPKESHLAPHDVIYSKGKARLLHYHKNGQGGISTSSTVRKQDQQPQQQQPLLIIYAPINTFHIMDLNPQRSIVRDLVESGGLDVYLLDWGYPDWTDNHLSLKTTLAMQQML